ncbi:MAG: S-type Pyocin family protein, partial [Bdellovibrionota bacterium]
VVAAHEFIKSSPRETLKKIRGTDRLFYHPPTNTFAVSTEEFTPRTMFKPKSGMTYWLGQSGKDVL